MHKLLIIDGAALLNKCYHGNLPMEYKKAKEEEKYMYEGLILHSNNGIYTNGIYSFLKTLEKILEQQKPSHIAITFDKTRNTFRKKLYPEYKNHRKETERPLKMQKEMLPQILSDMGFKVFISDTGNPETTFEGDDIIGSLCRKFKGQIPITILTNDHDMMQLVEPGINLWMDVKDPQKAQNMFLEFTQGENDFTLSQMNIPDGIFPFGRESVKWEMGVYPELVPDLKGLAGDTSDNIPGVKGISDKTAIPLLNYYGSLEEIFRIVKETDTKEKENELKEFWKELGITRPSLKPFQKENAEEMGMLCKRLATIVKDLDFPISLNDLYVVINTTARYNWYKKLNFKSLLNSVV